MKKKFWIFLIVLVLLVVATIVYTHYVPVWVSLINAVTFVLGCVAGFYYRKIFVEGK